MHLANRLGLRPFAAAFIFLSLAALAAEPLFHTTCPYCDAKSVQPAKAIVCTGSCSTNGGFIVQRTGQFKCHCGKKFTQPLEDKFIAAQPKAKEVK